MVVIMLFINALHGFFCLFHVGTTGGEWRNEESKKRKRENNGVLDGRVAQYKTGMNDYGRARDHQDATDNKDHNRN